MGTLDGLRRSTTGREAGGIGVAQRDRLEVSWWPPLGASVEVVDPAFDVTIGGALREAAEQWGRRAALVEGVRGHAGRRWTFDSLLGDAERVARGLLERFEPGDHVAIWAGNCPEWVLVEFGAALAGLTLVTVNPALREAELAFVLEHSAAKGVLVEPEYRSRDLVAEASGVAGELRRVRHVLPLSEVLEGLLSELGSTVLPEVCPDAPAQIQYTSGTTGSPKGALLSHRGLVLNARRFAMTIATRPDDVWINPMPLFHTAGCGLVTLGALQTGGSQVVPPGFDPDLMLDLIQAERGSVTLAVPTMLIRMLERQLSDARDVSSWRLATLGGAPVPPDLVHRAKRDLGVDVGIGFGQTEASPYITHTRPQDPHPEWSATVGRPLPQIEVKVADPETRQPVPPGEPGELCTRSACVMLGYYDDPHATADAVDPDGWLRTGDLGTMDLDGYVRIQGRLKDMIIRGGENIFPREIEDVLFSLPGLSDASVIGVPDPEWGEILVAFVVPTPGTTLAEDDLVHACKSRLASYKVPRIWQFLDALPQTASGKTQKFALRDRYLADHPHRHQPT